MTKEERDDWKAFKVHPRWNQRLRERGGSVCLVFHHPDGRMAKIKVRDFGLKRGRLSTQKSDELRKGIDH